VQLDPPAERQHHAGQAVIAGFVRAQGADSQIRDDARGVKAPFGAGEPRRAADRDAVRRHRLTRDLAEDIHLDGAA
jgi:hypothetical protein